MSPPSSALDGARSDLVVYFSGSRWDGPPGHDRHMVEALSRFRPVLFVEPPVSALTRLKRPELGGLLDQPRLRVLGPRLAHLVTPVVPGYSRPGLHRLVPLIVRRATRQAVDRLYGSASREPVAAVISSRFEDSGSALPARRRLFYATDDLVAGAEMLGLPRNRLLREEARSLHRADTVAVVSTAIQERYARNGVVAELIPNGCRPDVYADVDEAPVPAGVALTGPVVGLLGHINDRIDLSLLEAVADTGSSMLIVGPVAPGYHAERFAAFTERPNVCWVGPKPYVEMPSFLRLIDVGLTPYADNAFNRASFPLKTLEYLAAGRGVVATPLPAITWLGTDLVSTASTPAEFAARVQAALAVPRTEELAARRRAFAREHGWDRRAERLAELLEVGAA
ncbi:glycosyltransferase family 1 protein [Planosporangium flavigriseum]|nr:glycosyltransferase [Planosporangium flavigriseum]NJC65797.1 glycosyltransferase family 1 protein [Planosporangium flavigriseum]